MKVGENDRVLDTTTLILHGGLSGVILTGGGYGRWVLRVGSNQLGMIMPKSGYKIMLRYIEG